MITKIYKNDVRIGFSLCINKGTTAQYISRELNISRDFYVELLIKYGAKKCDDLDAIYSSGVIYHNFKLLELIDIHGLYYFNTIKKLNKFINSEELLPILMMNKLTE